LIFCLPRRSETKAGRGLNVGRAANPRLHRWLLSSAPPALNVQTGLMGNLTANPFANTISFQKTPAHGLPAEKFCETDPALTLCP
jgi:hypothetical protein